MHAHKVSESKRPDRDHATPVTPPTLSLTQPLGRAVAGSFVAPRYCQLLGSSPAILDGLPFAVNFSGDARPGGSGGVGTVGVNTFSFYYGQDNVAPFVMFDFSDGRRCDRGR